MDNLLIKFAYEIKKIHNDIKKFDIYTDDGRPCMCALCKSASEVITNHRREIQLNLELK